MGRLFGVLCLGLVLTLAGCGKPSKQEMMEKAKPAESKADIEKVLGKADKYDSKAVGPIQTETLTYKASDGEVVFTIMNGKVLASGTAETPPKK